MGYSIVGKYIPGKVQTFRRFVCDTTADVSTLPINVAFGSEAFCVEDGLTYILQNDEVWAEKVEGESGGNPNYTKVIEGTLENPWGDVDFEALANNINVGENANIYMVIQMNGSDYKASGFVSEGTPLSIILLQGFISDGYVITATCLWGDNGILTKGTMFQGTVSGGQTTNLLPIASSIQTTTTIYYHPMPETGG